MRANRTGGMGRGVGEGVGEGVGKGSGYSIGIEHVAANDHDFHGLPPLRVVYPADLGEVLNALEDLWLRLLCHPAIRSTVLQDAAKGNYLVLFRIQDCIHGQPPEARALLAAAADHGSYAWSQEGSRGTLVTDIHWIGNTLVLELTRLDRMCRWPAGEAWVASLQALLNSIQTRGGAHGH